MQLIINTETEIGIQRNMSAIEQESFDEKFVNNALAEKVDDEIPNINEDIVNIVEDIIKNKDEEETNEDTTKDIEIISAKCLNEISSEDHTESTCAIELPEECDVQKQNDNISSNIIIEDEIACNENSIEEKHNKEIENEEKETDLQTKEHGYNNVNGYSQEDQENTTKTNMKENTIEEADTKLHESDDTLEINTKNNEGEVATDSVENGEDCVISISDTLDDVPLEINTKNNEEVVATDSVENGEDCVISISDTLDDVPLEINTKNYEEEVATDSVENLEDCVISISDTLDNVPLEINTKNNEEEVATDSVQNGEDCVISISDTLDDVPLEINTKNNEEEVATDSVENGEDCVISISDEKEEECVMITEDIESGVEEKLKTLSDEESNNITTDQPTENKIIVDTTSDDTGVCIKKDDVNKDPDNPDITIDSSGVKPITEKSEIINSEETDKDTNLSYDKNDLKCNEQEEKIAEPEKKSTSSNIKDTKKLSLICKLSNNLDILSDEEEEEVVTEKESQKKLSISDEKQCINIEDDDDIMLIDEETNIKVENIRTEKMDATKIDVKESNETLACDDLSDKDHIENKESLDVNQDIANIIEPDLNEIKQVKPIEKKPLLSVNFLKTCKKNLADMTRDELEEFCILKIVESVVDRSNLSEIKLQLDKLSQNIEDYKKKALLLTKQNRDLQVVLKSVQEEQKIKSDVPITPLKITRSVGMQVFMTDKIPSRRKSQLTPNTAQNNANSNITPNRLNKTQLCQSPKSQKNPAYLNNTQQIPVPRLVPATNNVSINKVLTPNTISPTKPAAPTALPNGLKNLPVTPKLEKRSYSKMQQGNSVTVDLTDDEPPIKVVQRHVNPPVRLVSSQNLLASQRQAFGTNISSPRKVYIPISGSQNQVRPGQTIMLRPIHGPRHRLPTILPKPNSNATAVRMTKISNTHPAPLPDPMKQYQPPNWKGLPPPPELKLSKVENGIVISWQMDDEEDENNHEEIASYQLYAYQETASPPTTALWKKIGDVKALPLPMACTLTQFMAGYKYYFAVRAVDIRSRFGPFGTPASILLLSKM